ncbi:MAG: toll/interleukin-1 receptor domain-containing protein [Opitutus sp.]|nr:toll/interleukin-1 receptor domain-containing protein [Opitutus sp.]
MPDLATRAVFISYASEDAVMARRICSKMQAAGVEVWFDESELGGGDAWDAKIRARIRDCALFLAVISANTEMRREGYFRLEWKLAEDRSHLMAKGTPFILPVVIDVTSERGALVPDAFLAVQWVRVLGRDVPMAFAERVRSLLSPEVGGEKRQSLASGAAADETPPSSAAGKRAFLSP